MRTKFFLRQFVWLGCAEVLLATGNWAQSPSVGPTPAEITAREQLHSGEPRMVAWGAHEALVSRNPYLVPDLLSVASEWPGRSCDWACGDLSPELKDRRLAMAAVLDSIIQMNVALPVDTLRKLGPDFGNAVSILLARLPSDESTPLSMEFYRSLPGDSYALQYVSAALLALHPPPEFAADLLSNTTVQARVVILLPDSGGVGFGSSGSWGPSLVEPREGWPRIGLYKLSKDKGEGTFLVVGGIDPVYAKRQEFNGYQEDGRYWGNGMALGAQERRRFIAEMLGIKPEEIPWETSVETTIAYESMEQFRTALLEFVEEQEEKYRETAEALESRDLITGSEFMKSLPQLQLQFVDMREQDAEPFPKEMGLPDRVKYSRWPN